MFLLLILISISEFSFSFKCGHDKIKQIPKIINNSLVKNNTTRRLDTYHPISFFIDYTQMEKDSIGDSTYINFLKSAINSTLEIFENLIKVKRTEKLVFDTSLNCYKKIKYYDNQLTTTGVDYDIVLIPIIDPTLGDGVDAAASACYLNNDNTNNRPIMGFVLLNSNYSYTKNNAKD